MRVPLAIVLPHWDAFLTPMSLVQAIDTLGRTDRALPEGDLVLDLLLLQLGITLGQSRLVCIILLLLCLTIRHLRIYSLF